MNLSTLTNAELELICGQCADELAAMLSYRVLSSVYDEEIAYMRAVMRYAKRELWIRDQSVPLRDKILNYSASIYPAREAA